MQNLACNTILVPMVDLVSMGTTRRTSKTIKSKLAPKEEDRMAILSLEKLRTRPGSSSTGQLKGKMISME